MCFTFPSPATLSLTPQHEIETLRAAAADRDEELKAKQSAAAARIAFLEADALRVNQDVSALQAQIAHSAGERTTERVAAAERLGQLEQAAISRDTELVRLRAQLEEKEEALKAGTAAAMRAVEASADMRAQVTEEGRPSHTLVPSLPLSPLPGPLPPSPQVEAKDAEAQVAKQEVRG